jgi:hypothetical protein
MVSAIAAIALDAEYLEPILDTALDGLRPPAAPPAKRPKKGGSR